MNGAQASYKALTDAGLDTCFANPDTSEMQLVYAMGRTKNVRAVRCLEENGVTGAADGYARMTGKLAFTLRQDRAASLNRNARDWYSLFYKSPRAMRFPPFFKGGQGGFVSQLIQQCTNVLHSDLGGL
jgi:hypothetical protein